MKEKYETYDQLAKKYLSIEDYKYFQKINKTDEEELRYYFDLCEIEIYDSLNEGFKDYLDILGITGINTNILLSEKDGKEFLIKLIKHRFKDFQIIEIGNIFVFL